MRLEPPTIGLKLPTKCEVTTIVINKYSTFPKFSHPKVTSYNGSVNGLKVSNLLEIITLESGALWKSSNLGSPYTMYR